MPGQRLRQLNQRKLDVNIATMLIMNVFAGIARWKHHDFTSDEEHLIQETVTYTMAALLKPAGQE